MMHGEFINKKTGEKLILFKSEDFEYVNPIKHYGDSFVVRSMILKGVSKEELNGEVPKTQEGVDAFKSGLNLWNKMLAGFRSTALPMELKSLPKAKKKKEQTKLMRTLVLNPDVLMAFYIHMYENEGFTLSQYVSEHLPKGVDKSKLPMAFEVKDDDSTKVIGSTQLSDK